MAVAVGLDIGSEAVRAAVVESGKSTPVLRRFVEIPLPPGVVTAGDVTDTGAVSEAVAALWKRHRLPRKNVIIGIANQRVIVRQVDVVHLEESELVEALPYQVQDAIPIPIEDAVLDYVPLEEFTTPEGDLMLSILVIAAQREMVDGLVEIAAGAGLEIAAIDLQAFGLVRAAFGTDLLLGGSGPQALLDIGASMSQIVVVREGITRFVRILPLGGDQFTEALSSGLAMSREDAEEFKRRVGVAPEGFPEGDDEESTGRRILTRSADSLIDEIRGSVNYYLTQAGESALERLVVAGNGARLPHLANRVGQALNAKVEPVRVLDHVSVGRIQMTESQLLDFQPVLPAAVGLALWGSYVVPPTNRFAHVS
ncbi:MAG: type IV pilus assembly protein PilM [Acidobacteria bacterium]|nr:type IV pilus assembly protein PilM [Acidobacteriota bacterium]